MIGLSIWTIIAFGVLSVNCNSVQNSNVGNDVYFRMSGIFKMEKEQTIRVCNSAIETILSQLCVHGYNKRAFLNKNEEEVNTFQGSSNGMDTIVNSMLRHNSGRFQRSTRNIHSECCTKPCKVTYLLSHCLPRPLSTDVPVMTPEAETK